MNGDPCDSFDFVSFDTGSSLDYPQLRIGKSSVCSEPVKQFYVAYEVMTIDVTLFTGTHPNPSSFRFQAKQGKK